MNQPNLYRKRFLPNEIIHLKDDEILYNENQLIITKWNSLKPRKDISRGISCYFISQGFKVSKIYNSQNQIVYWYCDIIDTVEEKNNNAIIFLDLLIDVLVYEDGTVKVVDIAEVADALDNNLIDISLTKKALRSLDDLLHIIYSGQFNTYQKYINDIENELSN